MDGELLVIRIDAEFFEYGQVLSHGGTQVNPFQIGQEPAALGHGTSKHQFSKLFVEIIAIVGNTDKIDTALFGDHLLTVFICEGSIFVGIRVEDGIPAVPSPSGYVVAKSYAAYSESPMPAPWRKAAISTSPVLSGVPMEFACTVFQP